MKKNSINLLINREDYQRYENIFERLKLSAAILTAVLTIIFIFFFVLLKNKSSQYEKLSGQKKDYLQILMNNKKDEAKINYIQKKYSDLKTFLKDDASSVAYYEILSNAIKNSSESAVLKSLEVDKTRNTSFTITFNVFEKISLKNLVIVGDVEKNENYELSFKGKFIKLNK